MDQPEGAAYPPAANNRKTGMGIPKLGLGDKPQRALWLVPAPGPDAAAAPAPDLIIADAENIAEAGKTWASAPSQAPRRRSRKVERMSGGSPREYSRDIFL